MSDFELKLAVCAALELLIIIWMCVDKLVMVYRLSMMRSWAKANKVNCDHVDEATIGDYIKFKRGGKV